MNKIYTYRHKKIQQNFNKECLPLKISYHTLKYVRLLPDHTVYVIFVSLFVFFKFQRRTCRRISHN